MTSSLRSYPEMKDSGVGALGRVPVHWRIRKLGQIGRFSKGNGGSKMDELQTGIPCVRYGDLYTSHTYFIHQSRGSISRERVEDYTPISYGDVLFAASGESIEEIGKSAVNVIKDEAYCGGDIILFRPSIEVHPKFMGYATDFRPATDQKARMGRGFTVVHVYSNQLKRLAVPLPPLREQASIVRFLDHADRRIRRYIRAKEKLIALLEEQKQAIIHQAVTGQIDIRTGQPYPVYKSSDVEWLGDVPAHWTLCRLRNVVSEVTTGPRGWSSYASDAGPLFIRIANLDRGSLRLRFDDVVRLNLPDTSEVSRTRIREGDILMSVTAYIGSVAIAPDGLEEAYVSQHVARCRPIRKSSSFWLGYVLMSRMGQIYGQVALYGGTKDGLSLDDVKNYPIVLPPPCEQSRIVGRIERELALLGKESDVAQRQIDLVREYRTRLIADVVTGKLDVREAATVLPEEPDDSDAEETDCADPGGRDDVRPDRDPRTEVLATQRET